MTSVFATENNNDDKLYLENYWRSFMHVKKDSLVIKGNINKAYYLRNRNIPISKYLKLHLYSNTACITKRLQKSCKQRTKSLEKSLRSETDIN